MERVYDAMDRLSSQIDPLGQTKDYAYDANGNLTSFTDRKGQVATYSYDALNRRTSASYADGSTTSFSYDGVGRLTQAGDSVGGTIANAYDVLDRLTQQTTGLGTISYGYDALGRRTSMTAPGQTPVSYAYDAASRLTQVGQGSQTASLEYDALGRRTSLTLPNGVSTEYQYDAASRLAALIYQNALGPLGDLTYAYDAAGNRTATGGSLARTGVPTPVPNATYDAANRQLTFGDKTLTYDANGNLASITDPAGTTTFTWDARNRLVGLSGPNLTASFTYDALGRRPAKTINGQATQYLYDGADIIQEQAGGSPVSYLRGLNIDEAFVRNSSEFYLADALGSTLGLTDATGALTTRYVYDPFGRTAAEGTVSGNPFQYTGRENDGTGLYYYRARYYHPGLQRFVSEDPILSPIVGSTLSLLGGCRLTGGTLWLLPELMQLAPAGITRLLNPYSYVANAPISRRDPNGLQEEGICLGNCRVAYAVVCSLYCELLIEAPAFWLGCNVVCLLGSEVACHFKCSPPGPPPPAPPRWPPPPPPPSPPPCGRKCQQAGP